MSRDLLSPNGRAAGWAGGAGQIFPVFHKQRRPVTAVSGRWTEIKRCLDTALWKYVISTFSQPTPIFFIFFSIHCIAQRTLFRVHSALHSAVIEL